MGREQGQHRRRPDDSGEATRRGGCPTGPVPADGFQGVFRTRQVKRQDPSGPKKQGLGRKSPSDIPSGPR